MADYYGSRKLGYVAQQLDQIFGDIRHESVPECDGETANVVWDFVNMDMSPSECDAPLTWAGARQIMEKIEFGD